MLHVSETPAIFGPGNDGECIDCSHSLYNRSIVPVVVNYWISFMRSLDPDTHIDPNAPNGGRG